MRSFFPVHRSTLSGVSSWHEGLKGKVEFQGRMTARTQGGTRSCRDGVLSIEGADEAVIYISIATNFTNYKDITSSLGNTNPLPFPLDSSCFFLASIFSFVESPSDETCLLYTSFLRKLLSNFMVSIY